MAPVLTQTHPLGLLGTTHSSGLSSSRYGGPLHKGPPTSPEA